MIAPKLQGDGGFIDLTGTDGNVLHVRLQGECSKCAIVPRCMSWIEEEIKRDLGIDVTVFAERKKPFFLGYDLRRKRQWHLYR